MFTLNLKEVELVPRIEEDKSFSNESKLALESEVTLYIQEKYVDIYKNPLTIRRKISEAIRNEKGETFNDVMAREGEERNARFEDSEKVRTGIEQEVKVKYASNFEQMEEETNKKVQDLHNEYRPRIDALNQEGKKDEAKTLEEERNTKEDDIRYEHNQKRKALIDKEFSEIEEKVDVTLKD